MAWWVFPQPNTPNIKESLAFKSTSLRLRKPTKTKTAQIESKELDKLNITRDKFIWSAWKFFSYSTSTLLGFIILSQESWSFSPNDYFYNWPNHPLKY